MHLLTQTKILFLLMILSAAACGSDGNNEVTNNSGTTNNAGSNTGTPAGRDVMLGGDCSVLDTCVGASFCAPRADNVCGICTPFLANGDTCGTGNASKRCDLATDACDIFGTMTCATKADKDETCFSGQCNTGLLCKKEMGKKLGRCSNLIPFGQPCPQFFGCEANLFCDITDRVCMVRNLELGDDCSASVSACKSPYQCDVKSTAKCIDTEPIAPIVCDI